MATLNRAQPPERSRLLATGKLFSAAIARIEARKKGQTALEKAEKDLYDACVQCYQQKMTKNEVCTTISAAHSEFGEGK